MHVLLFLAYFRIWVWTVIEDVVGIIWRGRGIPEGIVVVFLEEGRLEEGRLEEGRLEGR
mgnify:CR=1 FL=1